MRVFAVFDKVIERMKRLRDKLKRNGSWRHTFLLLKGLMRQSAVTAVVLAFFELGLLVLGVLLIFALGQYLSGLLGDFVGRMARHPGWTALAVLVVGCTMVGIARRICEGVREGRRRELAARRRDGGRPMRTVVCDELERDAFVRALLGRLRGLVTRQTAYFALYGKWGEGKTTTIDYLVNLAAKDARELIFVDFNPWGRLQGESFANQMFRAIAERLRIEDVDKALQRKLQCFGARISFTTFRGLLLTLPELGSTLAYLCDLLLPLSSVKQTLNELLRGLKRSGRRIVVVIDDMDRMPPGEILELIRLIRTNGDLDYLTYLVLADDVYLAKAVQQMVSGSADSLEDGYSYLEKIFPHNERLPPLRAEVLPGLFMQKMVKTAGQHHFCQPQYDKATMECVYSYLTTMRRVKMLDEEVNKYLAFLEEVVGFGSNVNFEDLIALMAMKLFEKDFYERLYLNRKKLLDWMTVAAELRKEYDEGELREMLSPQVPPLRWEVIKVFLKECVGIIETYKSGDNTKKVFVYSVDQNVALSNFQLASAMCFENYYTGFTAANVCVLRQELAEFEQAGNDVEKMSQVFKAKAAENRLEAFVHFLGDQRDFGWVKNKMEFLRTLIRLDTDVFTSAWREDVGGWREAPHVINETIWYCILAFVRACSDENLPERSRIMLGAIRQEPEDVVVLSRIVAADAKNHVYEHDMAGAFFTKDGLGEARKIFCERIEARIGDRKMCGLPYEVAVRREWRKTCENLKDVWPDRMRQVMYEEAELYPEAVDLINSFRPLEYIADYEGEILPVDYNELKRNCPVERLIATLAANEASLTDKGRFFLMILRVGLERDKEGRQLHANEQLEMWKTAKGRNGKSG